MKKVLNVIGYISILLLPIICVLMLMELDSITNILLGVIFFILCCIAYLKHKKYMGISILKVVMSFTLCFAIAIGISNIKSNILESKKIIKIERTEVNARLSRRKKDIISKTRQDVVIYFEDGNTKKGVALDGGVISIDNKYYDVLSEE